MSFVLEDGVAIPPRDYTGVRMARKTQYPLDTWKEGQSFAIAIKGREGQVLRKKDGTVVPLTVEEDAARQARQKASGIAALARNRGQAVVTRWNSANEPGVLRVWHAGPYKGGRKAKAQPAVADDDEFNL